MSKGKSTRDPAELENLRRRIWVYRQRGMTLKQIGEAPNIDLSPSTVHHHLKKARNYDRGLRKTRARDRGDAG